MSIENDQREALLDRYDLRTIDGWLIRPDVPPTPFNVILQNRLLLRYYTETSLTGKIILPAQRVLSEARKMLVETAEMADGNQENSEAARQALRGEFLSEDGEAIKDRGLLMRFYGISTLVNAKEDLGNRSKKVVEDELFYAGKWLAEAVFLRQVSEDISA